ncbi:hypothetical protein DP2389 [Desulfotalea psychrophila LSv54]|uniref:Uncharacterized protein n=1 Tax=Desulfotalea psychrophila (strain LSv54 / DSM 12343) TaxID=177439 RepID=Q6AKK7_DESPS|nr:hypothetical protein DP2389 [Desulfotalea psychrophila LSv54]
MPESCQTGRRYQEIEINFTQKRHFPSMTQLNNPLHGIKLEQIVTQLVDHYGWDYLAARINIGLF